MPLKGKERSMSAAEEWKTTFDAIPLLVSMHDSDYRIMRMNKAFASLLKLRPEEVVGRKCYEVVHGAKEPWKDCPYAQAMERKESVREEVFEPRLGRHLAVYASPVLDKDNEVTGVVHIIEDITERKKAEMDLKKKMHELEIFYRSSVEREDKMLELKKKIDELEEEVRTLRSR